jgi:hypothetical protein
MKIQVKNDEVETVRGTGQSGRPYEMRKQAAYLLQGEEVRRIELMLGRDQSPYAPGFYSIDDRSYEVDRFGNLKIGRLVLAPLVGTALKVAS